MDVITSVKVPDYIYELYSKIAQSIGGVTTEDLMSRTLSQYASRVAGDTYHRNQNSSKV